MTDKPDKKPVETIETYKVILALLALGVGLYLFLSTTSTPDSFELNGFSFEEVRCPASESTCWQTIVVTNVAQHPIIFYSDPREVQDIPIDQEAVDVILNLTTSRNSSVTIAFDEGVPGEVGVAATLIARVTGERLYQIDTSGGVYGQDISCAQSQGLNRVIYLMQSDQEGAFVEDGCIIVTAPDSQRLRDVVDAYTMHLLLIL